MNIVKYDPKYIDGVVDVLSEISVFYNGANSSDSETIRQNLLNNFLGKNSDIQLILALEEEVVVGIATFSILYPAPKEHGQLFLKELFVLEKYRKRNMGTSMMKFIANFAIHNNCSRFDWTVDRENEIAVNYYNMIGASQLNNKLYYRLDGEALENFAMGR